MALYTIPGLKNASRTLNKSLVEARIYDSSRSLSEDSYDIFLSQRHLDKDVVLALYDDLTKMNYKVYVDWKVDPQMDRTKVNKETAERLRFRLKTSRSLLYVHTENSRESIWMPWELGYKDGLSSKVAILPILSDERLTDSFNGVEYLSLYPYVTKNSTSGNLSKVQLWIRKDANSYIPFSDWLTR